MAYKFELLSNQGTEFEFTVAQMLNQGVLPKTGCNRFRGSFFVTFLEKQKSKSRSVENPIKHFATIELFKIKTP